MLMGHYRDVIFFTVVAPERDFFHAGYKLPCIFCCYFEYVLPYSNRMIYGVVMYPGRPKHGICKVLNMQYAESRAILMVDLCRNKEAI